MLVRVLQNKRLFRPSRALLAANHVVLRRGLIRNIASISDVHQPKDNQEFRVTAQHKVQVKNVCGATARRPPQEISSLLAEAVAGNVQAQFEVGLYYLNVHNASPAEELQGAQYMTLAHQNGFVDSAYHMGICNLKGAGMPKDEKKGVEHLQEAAKRGHSEAQFALYECCRDGKGVFMDPVEAMRWCKLAADQGHVDAVVTMYDGSVDNNEVSRSELVVEYLTSAVEDSNASALYVLGKCYKNGYGVFKNDEQALKLWKRAADLGDRKAQYAVALHYSDSHSSDDHQTAAMYYHLAADQGCVWSQNNLGVWYVDGYIVRKDLDKALRYMKAARVTCQRTATLV